MSRQPPRRRPPAKRSKPKSPAKPTQRKSTAKRTTKSTTQRKKTSQSRSRPQPAKAESLIPVVGTVTEPETHGGDVQWTFRSQLKRVSLRDRPTQVALGSIALIIVLIAVIAAWPKSATETSELAQGAAAGEAAAEQVTDDEGVTADTQAAKTKVAANVDARTDLFQDNPFADVDYAKYVASQIKPQSLDYPNGNPNTWAGVTKTTIKAVFSYDKSNCGVNLINAISAAGAQTATAGRYYQAAPKNNEEADEDTVQSVDTLVKVFNRRGWEASTDFPQLKPLLEKFGSPALPFYGRKLVHELIDGGSFQCPETTNAAAVKIASEIKPFVVFNNFDGAQYNMADALNAKAKPDTRPMHFGTLWLSDKDYTRWAPFNWTQFNSGTRGAELYMSWACSRLVGKKAVNAPDYKNATRKFALLYPNLPAARHVADEYKTLSQKYCGTNIYEGREFAYNPDVSRAGDEGTSIAVRLKLDGVTTLTYVGDPLFPIFQLVEMQGQDYQPEFAWTPSGYFDSSVVHRIYQSLGPNYYTTAFGVTQFGVPGGFGFTAGDAFWAWHDVHQKSPTTGKACDPSTDAGMDHDEEYCKAPGAIVTWYYTTLPMLGGTIFAGPDLKPIHVTQGLQSYPKIRYGIAGPTDSPHPALLGSGPGKHYFIVDGLEYKWRGDYISPPPEKKIGWVHYTDCERHYTEWPDGLSRGWEKGGPNYGAFCGDAKYAPQPYKPSEGDCAEDAPGDKCRSDGYPRWQDWEQG